MGVLVNEDRMGVCTLAIDVASVAINTSVEQTFPLLGLRPGMFVSVVKPSLSAGFGISTARCSANDVIAITFFNNTAAPIDPALETYLVFWFRPENTRTAVLV